MSEEQLKALIAKAQEDSSLQEQLKAEGADVIAIAKAAGFSITTKDLNSHRQNLSDDELEGVAGGGGRTTNAGACGGKMGDRRRDGAMCFEEWFDGMDG